MNSSEKKSKEKFWEEHNSKFNKSGLSRKQYCLKENLSYWTFRDWQKKIEVTDSEKLVKIPRQICHTKNHNQSFIEVMVAQKICIRLSQDFDGELLRKVINELGIHI